MGLLRRRLGSAVVIVLLTGCGVPGEGPGQPPATAPPAPTREHWQLSHRVPESTTVRVVGQRLDDYSESTRVSLAPDGAEPAALCSVTVSVAGWGGPEDKVGEQLPATVQGRPALRNGPGAEGDYLMWQRADGLWVESGCEDDGQRGAQDRLAELVTTQTSDLALPFDVTTLPPHVGVTGIDQDRLSGQTRVYLHGGLADAGVGRGDLLLAYDVELQEEQGRPIVVAGHPASLNEARTSPGVCLTVQEHHVCVVADSSDTGPYPDRSDELPTMVAVAESLRFPRTLADRSSWFPAQDVFG